MIYSQYQNYRQFKGSAEQMQPTPVDIEGPFYKAGAPFKEKFTDNPNLTVHGKVFNTSGEVLKEAVLDCWQADEKGTYYMDDYTFRGKLKVDHDGHYVYETIIPGDYQIGEHEYRCAHLHVKVSAPGYKLLTTQLYFPDDKYNKTDEWFDARRVIQHPDGIFNFVLEKESTTT